MSNFPVFSLVVVKISGNPGKINGNPGMIQGKMGNTEDGVDKETGTLDARSRSGTRIRNPPRRYGD